MSLSGLAYDAGHVRYGPDELIRYDVYLGNSFDLHKLSDVFTIVPSYEFYDGNEWIKQIQLKGNV